MDLDALNRLAPVGVVEVDAAELYPRQGWLSGLFIFVAWMRKPGPTDRAASFTKPIRGVPVYFRLSFPVG